MADCDASQCVDETMPNVPRNVGRVVNVIRPLLLQFVRPVRFRRPRPGDTQPGVHPIRSHATPARSSGTARPLPDTGCGNGSPAAGRSPTAGRRPATPEFAGAALPGQARVRPTTTLGCTDEPAYRR